MRVLIELLRGHIVGARSDRPGVSVEVLNLDDLRDAPLDSVERLIAERAEHLEFDALAVSNIGGME